MQLERLKADAKVAFDIAGAALDKYRPLVTHLVITRRCNLSCGYCFEYDKVSPPVPTAVLKQRIDHLARLRSVFVTLTGGESLLHPDAAELVRYVRERNMTPFLNSNGYLLTRQWIHALNEAGLYGIQISVDNVTPNDVSKKSLKTLLPKLQLLAAHAKFRVRINCVLGSSPPEEAVLVARTALELGFDISTSLVRRDDGVLHTVDPRVRTAYEQIRAMGQRAAFGLGDDFTVELVETGRVDWKCRAGARTFMICEDGLVHLCAPRTSKQGVALADYTEAHIREAFHAQKRCAATCAIAYAHQASKLDAFRSQSATSPLEQPADPLVQIRKRPLA